MEDKNVEIAKGTAPDNNRFAMPICSLLQFKKISYELNFL